jgi:hypothetical protein
MDMIGHHYDVMHLYRWTMHRDIVPTPHNRHAYRRQLHLTVVDTTQNLSSLVRHNRDKIKPRRMIIM